MRRLLVPCIAAVIACGSSSGETLLVEEFHAAGAGAGGDAASIGLPYLIARALNGVRGRQALLGDARPAGKLYDASGRPDIAEGLRRRAAAGADRCLLGRVARSGNASTVTFYLAGPGAGAPEAFSAEITGDACLPALAAWAAGRIARGGEIPALAMPPALLPAFSRGLALLRNGDLPGAEGALRAAARERPAGADVRYLLGVVAERRGKPYDALRLYNEASNLDPGFSLPPFREGNIWRSLGRETLAEKAFDRAARVQPSFFEALLASGTIKTGSGAFAAAESALRRAVALRPGDAEARFRLAECLARQGKEGQARGILAGLVAERGDHGPARLLLGRLLFQAAEYRAAETEAREAVRLMPNDPEAHTLLADALSRQGGLNRHLEAEMELRKAIWLEEKGK